MIKKFGVPEATNRVCCVLIVAVQVRILVVVIQVQVVNVVLTILCSTPEIRVLARSSYMWFLSLVRVFSLAKELACTSCHSRRNVVTDAIPLQATLVFGLLRYTRNDKSQDRHTAFAMTIRTAFAITTLNLSLRWNVVTEAISLQFPSQAL